MKGIIFDFNGTMFQDSHLHEAAWVHMVKKYSKGELTEHDISVNLHGRTKEAYYRELCLERPEELKLTNGLTDVLDTLKENNIPRTIATATVKENLDFYFDIFKLGNWFDINKVVYDNGTFPGKPAPDIFLIASSKLGLDPSECLVVEDAFSGIKAARKANIGKIMAIDPFGKNAELFAENNMCKDGLIKDFTNFFEVSKEFK